MLKLDIDAYVPCHERDGCGWDLQTVGNDRAENLKKYMALASYSDERGPVVVINESRFPLSEPVRVRGVFTTYCEIYPAICQARMVKYH
ncbi:MAG: hypothetical protein NPIRA02_16270 [Nitrospirales bacterium]|nr:MAG: hypothetical protein NPIRA02_16270 [Nitrospirales bacterium]